MPHHALANHMRWYEEAFPLEVDDALLHKTPATFDVAVGELLAPLLAGARLALAPPGTHRDPAELVAEINRHRIGVLHVVPSLLRLLLRELQTEGEAAVGRCRSLQLIFCGGEMLIGELAVRALGRFRELAIESALINVYGPAEAAIRVAFQIVEAPEQPSVPIGRPIGNLRMIVLGPELEPAPPGVGGELFLGGDGPGRGYLHRPTLTAERFVPDPFAQAPGARLYRTGDQARYRVDGRLEFLGRRDHQVKLRGVRLELGEIEHTLRRHPAVENAVVLLLGENDDQRLIAGLVLARDDEPPRDEEWRTFLLRSLPEPIVPTAYVRLESLPLLENGKIDRHALARRLPAAERTRQASLRAPRDELELELVRLWEETLNLSGLGIDDDFFALGGHSLLAVKLIDQIEKRCAQSVPLSLLFEAATPEHLARQLRQKVEAGAGTSLVALRSTGQRPPLVLVHPLGGEIVAYRDLALALGDDQPVYGLRARGLARGEHPDTSLETMATRYVQDLLAADFEEPFRLGGWSLGGMVAFEMARQLLEQGSSVAPLLILDGRAERHGEALSEQDPRFWVTFAEHLGLSKDTIQQAIRSVGGGNDPQHGNQAKLEAVLRAIQAAGLLPPDVESAILQQRLDVFRAHLMAASSYRPAPLNIRIELFQAADRLGAGGEDLAPGWRKLALCGVGVHTAPGDHHGLVRGVSARHLAERIRAWLPRPDVEENENARPASRSAHTEGFVLTGEGDPEEVAGVAASPELLPLLGLKVQLGRPILPEDASAGSREPVVLLSHGLWQRRFGGAGDVLDKTLKLDGLVHTIIGVMAPGSRPPLGDADLWIPLAGLDLADLSLATRQRHYLLSVGRLAPGASVEQAAAELDTISKRLAEAYPDSNAGWSSEVLTLRDYLAGDLRPRLLALQAASLLLLLIVCAHLANLLVLRAARSRQELAVRAALGASRSQLLRRLTSESLLLAAAGGLAGTVLAFLALRLPLSQALLTRLLTSARAQPEIFSDGLRLDGGAVVYALLLSLATGLVFGTLPALKVTRGDLFASVLRSGNTAGSVVGNRLLQVLAVFEVALAMTLLVGAMLLVKSFSKMNEIDLGFDPGKTLVIGLTLPDTTDADWRRSFTSRVVADLEALPSITSAGLSTILPVSNHGLWGRFNIRGRAATSDAEMLYARYSLISPGTLETLRVPLLAGRAFEPGDDGEAHGVVVISRSFAKEHFGDRDPLGQEIQRAQKPDPSKPWLKIVGVVEDIVYGDVDGGSEAAFYLPLAQHAETSRARFPFFLVRTASDPKGSIDLVRRTIQTIDPGMPVADIQTLQQTVDDAYADSRSSTVLIGLCAVLALLLAVMGVYSVLSSFVGRHRREIGIRMSLGAKPYDILQQVLKRGLFLTLVGLLIGGGGAVLLARLLASQLYGIESLDLGSFGIAGAILIIIGALANYLPARRAAAMEPSVVLRYEL